MPQVAVFHGPNQAFELASYPLPEPQGREVLVKVACCTLCRGDLHTHAGRRKEPAPSVLGHEIVGRIEAFGSNTAYVDYRGLPLHVGDRITWSVTASCGKCLLCEDRIPQKCSAVFKYGHQQHDPQMPFSGGLAEYVLLKPGTSIVRIADSVPDSLAALANCATATAASVLREIGIISHRSLMIFGAGVLGLTATAMARTMGVKRVIVCEPDAQRREQALAFGATEVFAPDDYPKGTVDVALELAGTKESVEAAFAAPRVGGTVMLAGTLQPTPGVLFDPEGAVRRMLTMHGVHNYTPIDLAEAVAFLEIHAKPFPFADLIGPSFRLEEVDAAFAYGHAHPGQHVAIVPLSEPRP
ncbi:MAG: alcohol dehydrogenase [Gemmataceae bacterium]|nr:alcohol dehydrogenase [Gemmataceae bacterium]